MTVRCKFKCISKTQTAQGFRAQFSPVTCGSEENNEFFKWTPTGQFEFGMISETIADQFVPGEDYYIDIIHA